MLKYINLEWREHLNKVETLKRGIVLRAYIQKNPIQEFQIESFQIFKQSMYNIQINIIQDVYHHIAYWRGIKML